ncbi:DnaJ C-terminal domain-containing protein [Asticcacaulis sp. 201]|uniref:DnaJ C-terminal domain-containing protein n=1 Tax=Asticcacaulis sp. 201 TaxID=3028787 RepID=UPI0029163D9F|nr:DnaJ C-terminal domain-containing protein [Asticcacaulis sp. 201]MDV6332873.1 DnaJ C-terminal domain-containing protein [Asticcacaulis sp. 201]
MPALKSHSFSSDDRSEALDVLGLPPHAHGEDIRIAFRQRLKQAHPDLTGGTDARLRRLILARDLLMSDDKNPVEVATSLREFQNTNAVHDGIVPLSISLQQAIHGGQAALEVPAFEMSHAGEALTSLTQTKMLQISLPKGLRDGEKIRLTVKGGPRDDMFFRINIENDGAGRACGDDIWMTAAVDRHLLTYGGKAIVETPHGRQTLRIDCNVPEGASLCLRGRGLPATDTAAAGNLYIRLEARAESVRPVTQVLGEFRQRWAS